MVLHGQSLLTSKCATDKSFRLSPIHYGLLSLFTSWLSALYSRRMCCELFQINNRDARTAKLNVFVTVVCDVGNSTEILTYELPQNACSRTV